MAFATVHDRYFDADIVLQSGAVTTPRTDVDYVVTEYGVARLRGATLTECGRRLVAIAAPEYREALERVT